MNTYVSNKITLNEYTFTSSIYKQQKDNKKENTSQKNMTQNPNNLLIRSLLILYSTG